jgi:two-component sensor histidine kinase
VRVALRVVGPHIEVQVSDTGIGLPQALDPARTSSLGLRIVYILAKGLGASLKIASTNGACFTITFPVPAPR